ncbi:MAG: SusC/RagA family TonB-linked outer membrane protein [Bacteroidales bacterium]|nr:SusC/RagA family TonB-linked outer membrane protein [Bacteroidales bacterium]
MKKVFLSMVLAGCPLLPLAAQGADSLAASAWNTSVPFWESPQSQRSYGTDRFTHTPVSDFRNALTGLVPGLDVVEKDGSISPTDGFGSALLSGGSLTLSSRGFSSMLCIVDDVPVPWSQLMLDPEQIESVTVLTDVTAKALYGPSASLGALLIKTRRGGYDTPLTVRFRAQGGVSAIDRMPQWVDGVDYARLNNAARLASGYPALYSDEALDGFAAGNPYDRTFPDVDYRSLMVRGLVPVSRAGLTLSGGSARVRYNASLSGLYEGDIAKVGPAADFSRLNVSTSVDARINSWLEAGVHFNGLTAWRRGGNVDLPTAWRTVPATAFPLALGRNGGIDDVDGMAGSTVYAVSRSFPTNPYAALVEGGSHTGTLRSGMFQASLDADLGALVPGLKSRTLLTLNSFYYTYTGTTDDYLAYYWDLVDDVTDISTHKGERQSEKSTDDNNAWQGLDFYERLTWDHAWGRHRLGAGALLTLSSVERRGNDQRERSVDGIFNVDYSYASRYILQVVGDVSGSQHFAGRDRWGFFPAAAAAWVVSNEPFLRDSRVLDRLKVRAQAGLLGSDLGVDDFLYQADYSLTNGNYYGPSTSQTLWFGNERQRAKYTTINRLANPDLRWPTVFQAEAGFDAELLGCLRLGGTFFRTLRRDMVADVTAALTSIYGLAETAVYDNYTATRTLGGELSADLCRRFGDFGLSVGVSAASWKTVNTAVVSDFYEYDWQKKTGADVQAIWGYVCTGRFESEEELASAPTYSSAAQVGDLRYEDLNGDGAIDVNDRKVLGSSAPKLRYALRLGCSWKGLDVHLVGTGRAFFQTALTNAWFWNGWGDGNYSAFVHDHLGEDYPRLAWEKATDNFIVSSFWLRRGDWFKVQSAEVGYTFPFRKGGVESVRFCVTGSNLLTLSGIRDVDPESIDAGVSAYPLMRRVTAGIQLNF